MAPEERAVDRSDVLGQIVARKRVDVAARMAARPLGGFVDALAPAAHDFVGALRRAAPAYILECKQASPSQGVLREDFDAAALLAAYAPFCAAVSVLTDEPFFHGSLERLRALRALTDRPLLCKDFVVDPYQVYEARLHGADAILLMMSVLDDDTLRRCLDAAARLRMGVLCEVHDEAELLRALALPLSAARCALGVNNRDLRTLRVDLAVSERLAPRVPAELVLISESGIGDHGDVRRLRPRVDGFLVGSSLVRAGRVDAAVRELLFGRVKVCGLTRPEDAAAAWAAGARYGGLIFAEESPRRVDDAQAAALQAAAPGLGWVGVFVNQPAEEVLRRARALGLCAVQLHGEEDGAYAAALRRALPAGCALWRALRVQGGEALPLAEELGVDRLLLDAYHKDRRGGTGQRFDWAPLRGDPGRARELILSGGLSPECAAEADALGAWALDVNSGVEEAPGRKSAARLAALFAALRGRGAEVRR